MGCALCNVTGDLVYEDPDCMVVVHEDWSVLGHVMIVARRHVENISGLDEETWERIARVWQRTERVLLALTRADRCIALKLGVLTPHLHVHLYPVPASASREEIFASIDTKTRVPRDENFVTMLRQHLTPGTR
jgi:diadenosine tetraphosphate (Ap4A) HIT family hydrolase